jgi:predicted transcriptional regulator
MPLTPTSLKLDPALKDRIQKLAESRRRSINWLMGEALRDFVNREEARDEFDRITRERLAEYQADGKSVSAEKADAWLARLEAGEDTDPPEDE